MRKIEVDEVQAGMILAADVEDSNGYRILSRGTVLTDKQIALLATWRVGEVVVEDAPAEEETLEAALSADEEALKAARERLAQRFEGSLTNPWMKALYEAAEARLAVPRYWKTQV